MKKGNKKKDIERFEALRDAAAQIADGNFDIKKYYGITDDGLEAIYNIGYEMYNHKKCLRLFRLLRTEAGANKNAWAGR